MLVDSINKKLKVVLDICESLGIDNVSVAHNRVENIQGQYDFIVTRAVAKMDLIIGWSKHLLAKRHMHGYPNGWIALKGDIKEEKKILKKLTYSESVPLTKYINDPYYEGKYVLYAQGL